MIVKVASHSVSPKGGDTLIYLVKEKKSHPPTCRNRQVASQIKQACSLGDFSGKSDEKLVFYQSLPAKPKGTPAKPVRIMVFGLGIAKLNQELFREVGGTIAKTIAKIKSGHFFLHLEESPDLAIDEIGLALTEGLILGSYRFDKYQTTKSSPKPGTRKKFTLLTHEPPLLMQAVARGRIAAAAACSARDMANEPGNFWTPSHFAEAGRKLAKKHGLLCKVLGKSVMTEMGMGGIIGVNRGSAQAPKMVIIEYKRGGKKAPTILLVGKGLTFDSGGISLKPGAGMEDMKYDMCGGAAVLAVMQAIGEIKPTAINVIGIIPATENMPGPDALKPGDVITMYNGKTVEIINTDAEGRLILADALAYGVDLYKPDALVDIATLTGAVIIGLGHHQTGLLSNDDLLADRLISSGRQCGEPVWRLPLGEDYSKQLKSEIADLKNTGGRPAGTITGACFLEEFVGDVPWAHLDIAGTAWNYTKKTYLSKGPSGVGVRTLLSFIENWPAKK